MRAWFGLMVALMMIAPATGQIAAWEDAQGDQSIRYGVAGGSSPTQYDVPNEDQGWYPHFDIVRAGIYEETEDSIVFELLIDSDEPQGTEPENPYAIEYNLHFTYHEEAMRINMRWYHEWMDEPWGYVERYENDYWQYLTWGWIQVHPEGDGWTFAVDKWNLRDQQLIPAREGDVIGNIWATSGKSEWDYSGVAFTGWCPNPDQPTQTWGPGCGFSATDEAGSSSSPLGAYTLTKSPEGLGHILLETERPIRASNGLATTYVYELRLFNLDDEPDTVSLAASNIPSGWDVYLPPRVELEPGEIKNLRMAIGVPFGHKHGESASLQVLAKSERDPQSTSETTIVVYWPQIAQPSGHHPTLYFHSDGWRTWMNTVPGTGDPEDSGGGVVGARSSSNCTICTRNGEPILHERGYYWNMYLRPGLFTGLDFEVDKSINGNLEIAIDETLDTTVATMLTLYREDMEPIIIGMQEQDVSFTAGESTQIAVDMPVNAAADRIPYEANSALYFFVEVHGDWEGAEDADSSYVTNWFIDINNDMDYAAELYTSTSSLNLPLLDYHDEVDPGLLDALTRLQLEAPEEIVRAVNPGRTAAYFFEVVNKGDSDDTVEWQVEGPHAEWATVYPEFSKVRSQGKATVAIGVHVPEDAAPEEVADLLLVGQSTKNPEAQVFGQFIAYVETGGEIPDESDRLLALQDTAEETEAKGAPFPVAVALAAVAVALLARRRFA